MAVEIRCFDPPLSDEKPNFVSWGYITGATEVNLVERWWEPGYFSITVPTAARHADRLQEGRLVLIAGEAWGIIQDINFKANFGGDYLIVSGQTLNGLTAGRITIPPGSSGVVGAQGYDAQAGTTESIMRHFVDVNMGPNASPLRRIYGLELAEDGGRGVAEDKYISRHEFVSDALKALGSAANLGYDIVPDLARGKFVFEICNGVDRTALQSDRPRVIFDVARRTALSQEYSYSSSASRNLFYATMGGAEFADEALTATYVLDDEDEPAGIYRREQHLELSVDTPTPGDEYNELKRVALIEAESYRVAESFKCDVPSGGRGLYRKDYFLGDIVTVNNNSWGVTMHTRVTEMETRWNESGISRSATFGKAPLNVFGRLTRQIKAKK